MPGIDKQHKDWDAVTSSQFKMFPFLTCTAPFGGAFSLISIFPAFPAEWKEIFSGYLFRIGLVQWTGAEVMIKAGLVQTGVCKPELASTEHSVSA